MFLPAQYAWFEPVLIATIVVFIIEGLQEVVWVFWATLEGWKHACEHLEPQIFLVA